MPKAAATHTTPSSPPDYKGTRPGGRSERVRRAVLAATIDELVANGFDGLSMNSVARRADVALTTVLRRWGAKETLVAAAITAEAMEPGRPPQFGDLSKEIRAYARSLADVLRDPVVGSLMRGMLSLPEPLLGETRNAFWNAHRVVLDEIIARAVERGDIAQPADDVRLIETLVAPIWLRRYTTGQAVDDLFLDQLASDVLVLVRRAPD